MTKLWFLLLFLISTNGLASDAVTMKVDQVDVRAVLKTLAMAKQLNLVMSEQVKGQVSFDLTDVKWQTAIELITQLSNLDYEITANVLLVAPVGTLAEYRVKRQELDNKVTQVQPLKTRLFSLKFAKANELLATLTASKSSLLSQGGSMLADTRTNTLIVRDNPSNLAQVSEAISLLDVPSKQVVIEARMVTVRNNVDDQFGLRWGVFGGSDRLSVAGSLAAVNKIGQAEGGKLSFLDKMNVNLPVPNPTGRLALQVAKLADDLVLDLELSALERESKGEVIASPRILATDQHTSRIEQGTEIPYLQGAAHGGTSVAFKKAVLSLEVTPQITPDGKIILDLVITQDARGDTVITSTGPAVAIDTQKMATRIAVNNGETIVLGGIYQQQTVKASQRVPVLSTLPFIGHLFHSDSSYSEKRQLLVFVTPKLQ